MKVLFLCAGLVLALLLGYHKLGYNTPFERTNRAGGGNTEARVGRRDRSVSKSKFNSKNYTSVSQSVTDERTLAQGVDSSWRFLVFADIHGMTS